MTNSVALPDSRGDGALGQQDGPARYQQIPDQYREPVRILFTFIGGSGHFYPLVPVAEAAAAAGQPDRRGVAV